MLSEHAFNIRFVIDDENAGTHLSLRSSFAELCSRQRNNKFGKDTWLGINFDRTTMLFHHDVVAHRQPEPGALASRFGRKKGIEYLLFYLRRNSHAIVADADFYFVT